MTRPFVEHPADPVWFFCRDCVVMYDARDGHSCNPFWTTERAFAFATVFGVVFWVGVGILLTRWRG